MSKKMIYLVSFVLVLGLSSNISAELIGHWRFNEGSGNVAYDISGNGYDGTIEGAPNWVPGVGGSALEFDGTDDYVGTAQSLLNNLSEFTLACWVNPVNYTASRIGLIGQNDCIEFGFNGGGDLRCWNTAVGGNVTIAYPYEYGSWHHVAAVGTTEGMILYIDSEVVVGPGTAPPGDYGSSTYTVNIGGGGIYDATDNWFQGQIDDVRIYNHALTEQELLVTMESAGEVWPYAYGPEPADGALHSETWVNLKWTPGANAVSRDIYLGENYDDVNNGAEGTFQGNQTGTFIVVGFPGFAYPDGLVPGTTYYWRIDEVNDTEPNSPWKGPVWSFGIPPRTAYNPIPAEGAESVDPNVELSWTGGFGSKLHTVYFGDNFDDVSNATGGLPQGTATYIPGPLELAKTYYWRVDEFDAIETYKGDVWSFTTEGAVGNPDPPNGAVDVKQTQILTWSPNVFAASHQLYFGTDKDAVKNADTSSPEYKGTRDLGAESYDPGMLEWDTTYYWRIDEVNNTNPDGPWTGILWSFTTANFLVVDDFESYNDIDPPDPQSNRIFEAWLDGYEIPTNGALVGNELPPYAEQTIVHGGVQSMPYFYDNSVGNSEATLTLTYPRDWTENGVTTLTIWFIGDAANAAETLYVALNGSAVVNHDNPNAAQVEEWTEWNIDLQVFADQGVNLANVNTIAIGFGDKNNPLAGGSGMMYFDDIRLYRPSQ